MRVYAKFLAQIVLGLFCFSAAAVADNLATSAPSTVLAAKPECAPPPPDPSQWKKSLAAGSSFTAGNSSNSVLNINAAVNRDYENNVWDFSSSYSYGSSEKDDGRQTDKNEFLAKGSYKRVFDDTWFGGFGSDYRHDQVADVTYRVTLSPSIGAFLVRDDDLKFSIETGPSYIFEEVGDERDDYLAPRLADKFSWDISPTSKLYQSAEILIDATDSDNFIVNAEAGVEAAISTLFSLVFLVRDAYDHQPAEGRKTNDVAVITALKVNL